MAKNSSSTTKLSHDSAHIGDPDWTINAMPTKELFIDMLTRDISLIPAITDLVDNCADGAKRLRGDKSFQDLSARVSISSEEFRIADNCGGITVETARKYAFRFGRAVGAPVVKHSVGQFGVGMKRAIFKMGRKFRVESTTKTSRFVLDVDVDKWALDPKWEFTFDELEDKSKFPEDETGTIVSVTRLHSDVSEVFSLPTFKTELKNELEVRLQNPISKRLAVTLNALPVNAEPLMLLSDPRLAPAFRRLRYPEKGPKPVTVELYCGLGESEDRAAAGWHIFCNGRLILEGDKTSVTGWGDEADGISIPGFHGQYNHLRGFAYFDSDDPGALPWNTTKTGINVDSPVYRGVKLQMMMLMRPVVDFLNRLKDEKQAKEEEADKGPLEKIMDSAKPVAVTEVATRSTFESPSIKVKQKPTGPKLQKIQYYALLDKVLEVKKALEVHSYKEVGEKTFEYFYEAEVGE